ncbi:MAG TPA: NAD-binding protein, partial [Clostridia bacterium]|nr:NAD-binding protein [Clostridia bacterium]
SRLFVVLYIIDIAVFNMFIGEHERMRIIIVGDGKVGSTLSEHLSREGHDITIIDSSNEPLKKIN